MIIPLLTVYSIFGCLFVAASSWQKRLILPSHRFLLFTAWLSQAYLLYQWIDSGSGQNLSFFNYLCQVSWCILFWFQCAAWKKDPLLTNLILGFTAITIALAYFLPSQGILLKQTSLLALGHIFLSIFTVSILILTGLQALLLGFLEKRLRHSPSLDWQENWPSLEEREKTLFAGVKMSFILLTILLITSFLSYDLYETKILEKTFFSFLTWFSFGILLFGRSNWGWRGLTAVRWTGLGITVILIIIGVL